MKTSAIITFMLIIFCATAALAERLAVSVPIAKIRSGPGTDYDVIWKAEKFFPILVIEKKGKWYRFKDFEGDEGWISSDILEKTAAVITSANECNIRKGPGTDHEIAFKVEKGVPFQVLEEKSNWIHIRHADGDTGWIYKPLVW